MNQLSFDDITPAPDKRRAVEAALKHPKAATLSNYQIAAHCGVSEFMVRDYKKTIYDNIVDTQPQQRTVTRNGTTYTPPRIDAPRRCDCGRRIRSLFATCAECEQLPEWLI